MPDPKDQHIVNVSCNGQTVTVKDLDEAIEIIYGIKKKKDKDERKP